MPIREVQSKCPNYEYVDTVNRCQGCMYNGSGTDALYISERARFVLLLSTLTLFVGVITVLSMIMYFIFTLSKWQEERTINAQLVNAQQTVRRYGFKFLPDSLSTHPTNAITPNTTTTTTTTTTTATAAAAVGAAG